MRHIARVTLLAFLLNVFLPFFAVYTPQANAYAKQPFSVFGEKVLICTRDGFVWVNWKDLQKGNTKHKPHPNYKCPLCYLAAHGLKDITASDAMVLPYGKVAYNTGFSVYRYHPVSHYLQSSLHTRAPPYSIIG